MPLIRYRKYTPGAEIQSVIDNANTILREYGESGFNLTLRQLYYQFVARDLFPTARKWTWTGSRWVRDPAGTPNAEPNYKWLGDVVSNAREGGLIDWNFIVDRGRSSASKPHWLNPRHFMRSVTPQFNSDLWRDQPRRVEVWVEKDALSEVVARACRPLDVPYTACKGYMSASAIWDAAHSRMLVNWNERRQPTVILHLGDHDPSGIDMTRDIQDRLNTFSSQYEEQHQSNGHPDITVSRIALTREQIDQYEPPPNPAKETDSRFEAYRELHGDESWELDALEPQTIVALIEENIRNLMAPRIFRRSERQQEAWKTNLIKVYRHWDAVNELLDTLPDEEPEDEESDEE